MKRLKTVGLVMLTLVFIISCLDPVGMGPFDLDIRVSGDLNFTDVTAGSFVLHNLSRTIEVERIIVLHPSYSAYLDKFDNGNGPQNGFEWFDPITNRRELARFFTPLDQQPNIREDQVPKTGEQQTIFANASENSYQFIVETNHGPARIETRWAMPQSRTIRDFYLFRNKDGEVVVTPIPPKVEDGLDGDTNDPDMIEIIINSNFDPALMQHMRQTQAILSDINNGINIIAEEIQTMVTQGFQYGNLTILNSLEIPVNVNQITVIAQDDTTKIWTDLQEQAFALQIENFTTSTSTIASWDKTPGFYPSASIRIPVGNYEIRWTNGSQTFYDTATVQPTVSGQNPNREVLIRNMSGIDIPPANIISGISYSVPWGGIYFSTSDLNTVTKISDSVYHAYITPRLQPGQTIMAPIVMFEGRGTTAQRQNVVNDSIIKWRNSAEPITPTPEYGMNDNRNIAIGPGIALNDVSSMMRPTYTVRAAPETDCWVEYRIHPDSNDGNGITLRIYF